MPPWMGTDEQLKELVQKNSKSRVTNFWFEAGVYKTAKPTPKKKEEIGEFRLSIIREGLEEFSDLDLKDALQMLEEFGG